MGRGRVLRDREGEKADTGGQRKRPGHSPWGLLVFSQPDAKQLVPADGQWEALMARRVEPHRFFRSV